MRTIIDEYGEALINLVIRVLIVSFFAMALSYIIISI